MNKLKMVLVTALAAASIGAAGLATAPSASALPPRDECAVLGIQAVSAQIAGDNAWAEGRRTVALVYWALAAAYAQEAQDC